MLTEERDRLSKLKEEFLSTISHELRTPLTALTGALGLLNSGVVGEVPAKAQELIEMSHRNSDRLRDLIQDLLDLNKLQAGRMEFDIKRHPLKPILDASLERNQLMAEHYQVQLELETKDIADLKIDASRLQQIIDNYLSNAIKHAPSNSVVTLSTHRDGSVLVITVTDRGEGVPEHFKQQLFTRFAQAEVGTTRAVKGTGLGLAICKEIAEHMSGQVGYHDQDGTHFWVRFPAVLEPRE